MQTLRQFDENYEECVDRPFDFDDCHWQSWLESEGFEHISGYWEDSYGFTNYFKDEVDNKFVRTDYWYWCKCFNHFMIRIYVFRNCVVIDKDWDFGGNCGGRVFEFDCWSIEDIWNDIIDYIKKNISD